MDKLESLRVLRTLSCILYPLGEALQIHASEPLRRLHLDYDGSNPARTLLSEYSSFAAQHPLPATWLTGHLSNIAGTVDLKKCI